MYVLLCYLSLYIILYGMFLAAKSKASNVHVESGRPIFWKQCKLILIVIRGVHLDVQSDYLFHSLHFI